MKYMTTGQFVKASLQSYEAMQESARLAEADENKQNAKLSETANIIVESQLKRRITEAAKDKQSKKIKEALLEEFIHNIYSKSFGIEVVKEENTYIRRHLVKTFIEQNNAYDLLIANQYKSGLLMEMVDQIEDKYRQIVKECSDTDTFELSGIDQDMVDDFYKTLEGNDTGTVTAAIQSRVADAVSEFINQNTQAKYDIQDVLDIAKEKIEASKDASEEIKEGYNQLAKRKISDIRHRKKNLFGSLVSSMIESTLKDQKIKDEFVSEGTIDVDLIIERVTNLYTLLETFNTLKLIDVNEAFIEEFLAEFRS